MPRRRGAPPPQREKYTPSSAYESYFGKSEEEYKKERVAIKVPKGVPLPENLASIKITETGIEELAKISNRDIFSRRYSYSLGEISRKALANIILDLNRKGASGEFCANKLRDGVLKGSPETVKERLDAICKWLHYDFLDIDLPLSLFNPRRKDYKHILESVSSDLEDNIIPTCSSAASSFWKEIFEAESESRYIGHTKAFYLIQELVNAGALTILPERWPFKPLEAYVRPSIESVVFKDMYGNDKRFTGYETYGILLPNGSELPSDIEQEFSDNDYMDK